MPGSFTRAKKADGGFLLNGAKMWISNAPYADVFDVWAKDEAGDIRATSFGALGALGERQWQGQLPRALPALRRRWRGRPRVPASALRPG